MQKIFVYGSLMKGGWLHKTAGLHHATKLCDARAFGLVMFDLGAFPAVVHGKGIVYGEVYEVTPGQAAAIDRLEGSSFKRERRVIESERGARLEATLWRLQDEVEVKEMRHVRHGRWRRWLEERERRPRSGKQES